MELLGDRNWWLPSWLKRIVPTIDVEGTADAAPLDEDADREPALSSR
jgi:RND superfamily putative drug exporter